MTGRNKLLIAGAALVAYYLYSRRAAPAAGGPINFTPSQSEPLEAPVDSQLKFTGAPTINLSDLQKEINAATATFWAQIDSITKTGRTTTGGKPVNTEKALADLRNNVSLATDQVKSKYGL